MMTPQIFINYKFKSTVHLPWRALTYKAADAFLDSACALVIQAPSYYRIGFFRHGMDATFMSIYSTFYPNSAQNGEKFCNFLFRYFVNCQGSCTND